MFIDTKNICDCQSRNKHRLKLFVSALFFLSFLPAVLAKTIVEYNNGNYEEAVIMVPKVESAKDYTIQVDDSPNFMSPEIEKNIPANREKAIFRLLKKHAPYYWRYQAKFTNGETGDWKDQLEVPKFMPAEDKLFMIEGDRFRITDPIYFYFYIRNNSDFQETYEYDASIRTDVVVDKIEQTEARGVVYGKVDLRPRSSRLIRAEMKVDDFLEVNKKYKAVARINNYSIVKDFYIVPSYKADISTKDLEKGTGKKVKIYITNISDEKIEMLKANISTSYNLTAESWWDQKEASDIKPGVTEYFEWDVNITEPAKSEVNIDIFSDGGTQRLKKMFIPYQGALVTKDFPEYNFPVDEIFEIKFRIANILDIPHNAGVELKFVGAQGRTDDIEILNKMQKFEAGGGSGDCAKEFSGDCSADLIWRVIGKNIGTYEYYLSSEGYDIRTSGIDHIKRGKLNVIAGPQTLNLKINREESMAEVRSDKTAPFDFDMSIRNYSNKPDTVKIRIVPKGKGWYIHFYEEQELKNGNEFKVGIDANSTKHFRLVLSPQLTAENRLESMSSKRFEAQIFIISAENPKNSDEARAIAVIE